MKWVYDPVFEWWHLEPMNKPRNLDESCELNKLKRELNAANERIKRLEEAGDDLYVGWGSERNNKDKYLENWKQAKEAKP